MPCPLTQRLCTETAPPMRHRGPVASATATQPTPPPPLASPFTSTRSSQTQTLDVPSSPAPRSPRPVPARTRVPSIHHPDLDCARNAPRNLAEARTEHLNGRATSATFSSLSWRRAGLGDLLPFPSWAPRAETGRPHGVCACGLMTDAMGLSLGVGGDGRPATSVAVTVVWPEAQDMGEMLPRASGAGAVPDPEEEELEELIWSMEKYMGRLAQLRLCRRALALFEVVLVGVMVAVCGRAGSVARVGTSVSRPDPARCTWVRGMLWSRSPIRTLIRKM
ncbi:hypothetical protein B0H14DRAFT_3751403 [Mycena olivaceomarginata]|nr:hypothetical protein B0H14DRAFT_3751403 [Mycena olivaceomarginata]